jgi:serine/threonine protein phosphatase PrpC
MIKRSAHSIANPADLDDGRESEDALNCISNNDYQLLALSDGAGGVGVFCGEWARALVAAQPEKPFGGLAAGSDAKTWFLNVSESFYKSKSPALEAADSLVREKFFFEGSYATLLFCWIANAEDKFYYIATGDTTLFQFRTSGDDYILNTVYPIDSQQNLFAAPRLLNWKLDPGVDWIVKEDSFQEGDVLILCTDALSRWLLLRLFALHTEGLTGLLTETLLGDLDSLQKSRSTIETPGITTTRQLLAALQAATEPKEEPTFQQLVTELAQTGDLEEDDYSLIFIKKTTDADQ